MGCGLFASNYMIERQKAELDRSRENRKNEPEDMTTMGISLSVKEHEVLKKVAAARKVTISKVLLESIDFKALEESLENV
jgi:hypothetical protein